MIVLILLAAVATAYIIFTIGEEVGLWRRPPYAPCEVHRRTLETEVRLQRLTHHAMHEMVDVARQELERQRQDELGR